jgi:hypothetical protein
VTIHEAEEHTSSGGAAAISRDCRVCAIVDIHDLMVNELLMRPNQDTDDTTSEFIAAQINRREAIVGIWHWADDLRQCYGQSIREKEFDKR